jgi:hypothetical protein
MKTEDLSIRLRNLVSQVSQAVRSDVNNQYSEATMLRINAMLDFLQYAIFSGRYWGGLSSLHRVLAELDFTSGLQRTNLPSWNALSHRAVSLGVSADRFASVVNRLARQYSLPKSVNAYELLKVTWVLSYSGSSLADKIREIVLLYRKDLASLLSRFPDIRIHLVDGKTFMPWHLQNKILEF